MNLPSAPPEHVSLLYVEDERDARELLSSMIGTKYPNVKLFTAEDGQEGLESYLLHNADILLTDISMPKMDGLQLARKVKELNPAVMIIVLTARTDTQYLLDSIDIGIHQYVLKPIVSHQLFAAIDKCVDSISVRRMVKKQHDFITSLNDGLAARTRELELLNCELEAFNYTVSHDLRTPLTVISGYCQVLKELYGPQIDAAGREYIDEIMGGVRQMNDLIATLLNYSKINRSELNITRVDLGKMATDVSENLKRSHQADRNVVFKIMQGVKANGDKVLLKVLLENLLGNAMKYTSTKDEAHVEFGVKEIDGKRVYFVHDNGVGFDNKFADSMFAPFQRLENSKEFEGSGIGLATVKRIVQLHGGDIWAEGAVDKEATFFFTLQE
jgi:signal transduction histidine kinase